MGRGRDSVLVDVNPLFPWMGLERTVVTWDRDGGSKFFLGSSFGVARLWFFNYLLCWLVQNSNYYGSRMFCPLVTCFA